MRLAHYEIQERIGKGGMGVVYKARDTHLGRVVAVKVLPPLVSNDPERRSRFLREAQAAANLNHPNIATIYQFGTTEVTDAEFSTPTGEDAAPREVLFLAMEYVAGEDLQAKIGTEDLPVERIFSWGIQIAEGLEAAHEAGVIHRDLKPNNVRITHDGRVKLLDFGLAKVREERLSRPEESVADIGFQTSQGMLLGTPPYMAPEMLKGTAVDHRSDLFSLGVVLFQLLAGEPPYPADNILEYVKALSKKGPPSLRQLRPEVTADQEAVVQRLLAHEPEDRFESAHDVARALRAVGGSAPTTPVTQLRSWHKRRHLPRLSKTTVAAGILTLIAAIALVWFLVAGSSDPAPHSSNSTVALFPFANLSSENGYDILLSSQLAFLIPELGKLSSINLVLPGGGSSEAETDRLQTAKELGAEALLHGSLQKDRDLLILAIALVDTKSNLVLWSQSYRGSPMQLETDQRSVARDLEYLLRTWHHIGQIRRIKAADLIDLGFENLKSSTDLDALREATRYFDLAIQTDAEFTPALVGRSAANVKLFRRTGNQAYLEAARSDAEKTVQLTPASSDAHMALGIVRREQGSFAAAIQQFETAQSLAGASTELLLELAITYQISDRLQLAEETLRAAAASDPGAWDVLNQLGMILLTTNRKDEARDSFEKAERVAPPGTVWPTGNLVVMALMEKDYSRALQIAARLPEPLADAEHAANIGTAHFQLGDLRQAQSYYRRSIELSPGNARLYRNLGDALELEGRLEESRIVFQQAALLQAETLERVHNLNNQSRLALYQAKAGDCPAAVAGLGSLVPEAIETNDQAIYVSQALALCGKTEASLRFLELALRLGYSREEAAHAAEFRKIRNASKFQALVAP